MDKLHHTLTACAGEYYAAAELSRRGFAVTVTLGHTKSVDLLAEKEGKTFMFQVKSIQRTRSISFTVQRGTLRQNCYYILVNLHADTLGSPEFFILTANEMQKELNEAKSGRDWINYNYLLQNGYLGRWASIR